MWMHIPITFEARRLTRYLLFFFLILLACQAIIAVAHLWFDRKLAAFTVLFDMDLEANLPVFYNTGLFFLLAALCHVSGRGEEARIRRGWTMLALVFIFLGVDEGSQIHEKFMLWTMRLISNEGAGADLGIFHYAWVIPYSLAAILFVVMIAGFLLRLSARTRTGLIVSGCIFVLGAVVAEMVSGTVAKPLEGQPTAAAIAALPCEVYQFGECNLYLSPAYVFTYMLEESLEMCGLIACIHVVMRHLQREGRRITIEIPKAVR
jgi:hypothetical protein